MENSAASILRAFCVGGFALFASMTATHFVAPLPVWVPAILAVVFAVLVFWQPPQLLRSQIITGSPWAVVTIFSVGILYLSTTSVIALSQKDEADRLVKEEIYAFSLALQRWVVPRRLTPQQVDGVASELNKHLPYRVRLSYLKNDDEASAYAFELSRALSQGGWTILKHGEAEADLQPGLRINFSMTMATAQEAIDSKKPKPDAILLSALRANGIQIDGSSGGSGVSVTEDSLKITVGARKRDTTGFRQALPGLKPSKEK
jgi:hypothetical protein